MNKKELKLEVGKRYARRDGKVTSPLRYHETPMYPFYCDELDLTWTVTGKLLPPHSTPADLVAEYIEPYKSVTNIASISAELVVSEFNKLVCAGKVGYRLWNETGLIHATAASKNFVYELLTAPVIKIKLPDSGYECVLKNDRVFVGCQDFGPIANFKHVLTMLLGDSAEQTSEYHDPIKSIRSGLLHRKGQITWNDADTLLKFLEKNVS
jgi:hypothetical protein